jgi:hypothetical protein
MFEPSLIKCINCDIFYEPNNFFEKDIKNMRENYKLIHCKKCINNAEYINKKNKLFYSKKVDIRLNISF